MRRRKVENRHEMYMKRLKIWQDMRETVWKPMETNGNSAIQRSATRVLMNMSGQESSPSCSGSGVHEFYLRCAAKTICRHWAPSILDL